MVRASGQDAFQTPPSRGVSDMSNQQEASGQTELVNETTSLSWFRNALEECSGRAGEGDWKQGGWGISA